MESESSEVTTPLRMGVLLSGSGRTLENFLRRIGAGELDALVVAVASNRPAVRGVEVAQTARLPVRIFPRGEFPSRAGRDARMLDWLHGYRPDVLCLAGYLSLLDLAGARGVPVLNIHPALLPRFGGRGYYGDHVHEAVLRSADRMSGATVHLVNPHFDEGAILARIQVPVQPNDDVKSLAARVFAAECELYPRVLQWMATGRLRIEGGMPFGEDGRWEAVTL